MKIDKNLFFEKGFPIENPKTILEWEIPLDKVAKETGGNFERDRYVWRNVKYLNGLEYTLTSENGIALNSPFKKIFAYIGLENGLWSDQKSIKGYNEVKSNLLELFGEPDEKIKNMEMEKCETLIWKSDTVVIILDIINQFSYRCYLTISHNTKDLL